MTTKDYQDDALRWLELYWSRCKDSGNPAFAYAETTREWRGTALPYLPLPQLPDVPYVCLRIPTGGGKTFVAGLAIERANRALIFTRYSLTLWLVPTEPIREQTLKALKTPGTLIHSALQTKLGSVTVLDISEALYVQPATLDTSNVIIVATMQAFKQEETDKLTVYKQNGQLMPHFSGITAPEVLGNKSLVDVLRMRHPLVIVDEAHNQGSQLAFDTLARFEPSAILELTATPDRTSQPSNVLFSVSAAALQAAEMIKLPLELVARPNWQDAVRDAIACLNGLQKKADAERAETGEYLRPIMLLQAERHDTRRDTFTPEVVKKSLIADFGIAENEIAIATAAVNELAGKDVLTEASPIRFIITVDKLREGWDCPFAYVLCTFRPTTSATAVEQILGRILRMPHAKRKRHAELNEAYAFATSTNFQETAESLKDGLVRSGFERQEANELIHAREPQADDLFTTAELAARTVTFELPELPSPATIPPAIADKIEIVPESGSVTFKGRWTASQEKQVEQLFSTPEGKAAVKQALERLRKPSATPRQKTPAELGELFRVPLLAYHTNDLWEDFEETHLLDGDWRLIDFPCELGERDFKKDEAAMQRGRLTVNQLGKIKLEYFDKVEAQMALFDMASDWTQSRLVWWLERNIYEDSATPEDKSAFLNQAVSLLMQNRDFTLDELIYRKFRLRAALAEKVKAARHAALRRNYQLLLTDPQKFSASEQCGMIFEQARYAYNWPYAGFTSLPKHFFPVIGDLKEDGEEFRCAVFLATQLSGVKYWVRNISGKASSFSLQTSSDRFYPDFVCLLEDGRILVVEYKNTRDWELKENEEKRILGELWSKRSDGKCLFIMPRGEDYVSISKLVERAST